MISWRAPVYQMEITVGERPHDHCEFMAILISIQYFGVLFLTVPFCPFTMQYFIT